MLDYLFDFYISLVSAALGILKSALVKFFVFLIISMIYLSIFFSQIAWEVAKEFIQLSNVSQYISQMYSLLSPELTLIFFQTGIFDFVSFVFTAHLARLVSSYIPFSKL